MIRRMFIKTVLLPPLNREHNNDTCGDTEGHKDNIVPAETLGEVLTAISKVSFHHSFDLKCTYICFSSEISFKLCIQVFSNRRHG